MTDLLVLFDSLSTPEATGTGDIERFSAQPLPGYSNYRLGKDLAGAPALLVQVAPVPSIPRPASIELQHLSVSHAVQCRITNGDGSSEIREFSVIRYRHTNVELQRYFLRVLSFIVPMIGQGPSEGTVGSVVERVAELFKALAEPQRKSSQGLWGELLLLASARDPLVFARAWHTSSEDRYDFNSGPERIEVKTAGSRTRQHHFSLEQLSPPHRAKVLIASLFAERSGNGTSLSELLDEIGERLTGDPSLAFRVEVIVGKALGDGLRVALADRFDRELAQESLRYYAAEQIPRVSVPVPRGVSEVRFRSDLMGLEAISLPLEGEPAGLFVAAPLPSD